jgi:hypothetical protein
MMTAERCCAYTGIVESRIKMKVATPVLDEGVIGKSIDDSSVPPVI